jgi:hypothetical protein
MPIGKIGGGSVPDLSALDSNPQSVASTTGTPDKTGSIGHRAVQWIGSGLRTVSHAVREVAESFAHAIESRFSGSAKDNLKSLLHRNPTRTEAPIELKRFTPQAFHNSTYGDQPAFAQSDYASFSNEPIVVAARSSDTDEYVTAASGLETDEYVTATPSLDTDEYVNAASGIKTDEYIDFDPGSLKSSLKEIAAHSAVNSEPIKGVESFVPDATSPADTNFYELVHARSSPALKQSLGFIRQVIDHHGAAGGQALADAGIFKNNEVIGQITPELFNAFERRLKEVKASNATKFAEGFDISTSQIRFDKYNSDNADSPVHAVLSKAVFASSPQLANKTKWEFDRVLSSGVSGARPKEIAEHVARQVIAEALKESFDAGRSDSPLNGVLARSALANSPADKLVKIKASFDDVLKDAALDYAYEGGLDKPFNAADFAQAAVAAAHTTIQKYTF